MTLERVRERKEEKDRERRRLRRFAPCEQGLAAHLYAEYNRLVDVIEKEKLPFKFAKLYIGVQGPGDPWLEAMLLFDCDMLPANLQARCKHECRLPGYSSSGETKSLCPWLRDRQEPCEKN